MSTTLESSSGTLATGDFCLGLVAGSFGVVCASIEAASFLAQAIGLASCSHFISITLLHPVEKALSDLHNRLEIKPHHSIQPLVDRAFHVFTSYGLYRIGVNIQEVIQPMRIALLEHSAYRLQRAYKYLSS